MQPASVYKIALEKRVHRRIDVTLSGRYMLPNKQEYRCQTLDVSVSGIAIRGFEKGSLGDNVIVYLDEIGRVEGTIIRHIDKGFAIRFDPSPAKRERLLEKLTWLMNRDLIEGDETRRFSRQMPPVSDTKFFLPDGRSYPCKIIDMSISGASIEIDIIPDVGAEITLGKMKARVIRHHDNGIAVEFTDVKSTDTLADHFGQQTTKGKQTTRSLH